MPYTEQDVKDEIATMRAAGAQIKLMIIDENGDSNNIIRVIIPANQNNVSVTNDYTSADDAMAFLNSL